MSLTGFAEWMRTAHVLIVDDQLPNIVLLQRVFQREGWRHAEGIYDARLVVDKIRDTTPDIVLLDIHMPHVQGLELVDSVLALTEQAGIPVAVVTADAAPALRDAVYARGVRDMVIKPFDMRELVIRTRNLLEIRWLLLHAHRSGEATGAAAAARQLPGHRR